MSESQTWATVVKMSTSRRIMRVRSMGRGAPCRPSSSTRPPRRVAAIAAAGASGAPLASITMSNPAPSGARAAALRGPPRSRSRSRRLRGRAPLQGDPRRCRSRRRALRQRAGRARHEERADAARADHGDGVGRSLRDPGERVERDGERLRHRRRVVVALPRNRVADRRRRRHVLGEPAVHLKPERPVLGTQVRPSSQAPGTAATRDPGPGDDPVADAQGRDLIADPDDTPHELVPEDHAGAAEDGAVIPFRGVRAADRRAGHLEHDLRRSRLGRFGNALDPDVTRPVEDGRLHGISTRSGP